MLNTDGAEWWQLLSYPVKPKKKIAFDEIELKIARFLITDKNGFDCWVPWYILEGEHPKRKAFKDYIVEKRIGNNRGLNVFNKKFKTFNFDCSYSKLDRASARKLASWILEVSK